MSRKKTKKAQPPMRAEPEVRSCCPACGSAKTKKDNGLRRLSSPLPHPNGGYRIGTRYLVCECGQNYAVPVIDRSLGDEEAA